MPAAEAAVATTDADERQSYELAFHVLPTVAEGEVATVFTAIKDMVGKHNGEVFDEEAPERFDLAYEIVKHLEGKNRKFSSAYFGWIRFKAEGEQTAKLAEEMEARTDILRHLLIRLSRVEEEHPFRFHEALAAQKMVSTVDETDGSANDNNDDNAEKASADSAEDTKKKEVVDEEAIDEALKKDEA